jgi:hypothetical protein
MKKNTLIIAAVIFFMTSLSFAQFTGQLAPAVTVAKNTSRGMANIGVYDGALGLFGEYRYGIGGYTDAAAKIGFVDFDGTSETGMIIGGDLKYQVMELRIKDPIDLSVGGQFESMVFIPGNFFTIGPYVVGSYPVKLNSGKHITPYGKLIFRMKWYDAGRETKSEFNLGFNTGATLELNSNTSVSAEFQFHDPVGFLMGMSFGF